MPKSITVQIGADTTSFVKGIEKAEKEIGKTSKSADKLSKSLEFKFSDTKFTAAQKKYQKALSETEGKIKEVQEAMKRLEQSGKMNSEDYEKLQDVLADLEVQADKVREKLQKLSDIKDGQLTEKFESVGKSIENAGKKLAPFSLLSAGIITGATAAAKSSAKLGAELDDMSLRFGISAEKIQEWQYVAVQCGVEQDTFTKSLVKMRAAMADLSTGTENAASKTLQALGISPDQFRTQEEMFDGIVAALANVKDATLQTAYANELFGDKIATQMLPYINTGSATIKQFKDEFAAMPSLTNEQVAALATLDDTFYRLSTTMKYATAQLGVSLAPVIERVVVFIEEKMIPAIEGLANWFDSLSPGMQDVILAFLTFLALGSPFLKLIGKMVGGIGSLISGLKNLKDASWSARLGMGALVASLGLALKFVANLGKMELWQTIVGGLGALTAVALSAALALGAFHSAATLGVAVAGIVAGIAAMTAAIATVKDEIDTPSNLPDYSVDGISNAIVNGDYSIPNQGNTGNTYADYSSRNDEYNITINVAGSESSAEEIAEAVSKKIATMAQSRG